MAMERMWALRDDKGTYNFCTGVAPDITVSFTCMNTTLTRMPWDVQYIGT
jgi:hypothetical protein